MIRPLPLWIGWRYTRAKRHNHFISFISLVSMLGIILGVAALIVVISVMNGFESELKQRMLAMISHVTVESSEGSLKDWLLLEEQVARHPEVRGVAPYIEQQTLLRGQQVKGVVVRGVLPEQEGEVDKLPSKMVQGSLDALRPGEYGIVLGVELAWSLAVSVGDSVTLFAPQLRQGPAGVLPQVRRFTVVGLFEVGMNEYDGHLAVIHLRDAQRLFRMPDQVSGLRLKLADMDRAWLVARQLAEGLPWYIRVNDWISSHSNWFRAVQTEKVTMFIILSLIVAVAAFNIISTLVMAVTDKQAEIAILRTQGMTPGQIMGIFIVQGSIIGLVGTLVGLVLGVALALNVEQVVHLLEQWLHTDLMPDDLYYITDLRGEVRLYEVLTITGLSFAATLLSTLYPSWRAARTRPVEALRYE